MAVDYDDVDFTVVQAGEVMPGVWQWQTQYGEFKYTWRWTGEQPIDTWRLTGEGCQLGVFFAGSMEGAVMMTFGYTIGMYEHDRLVSEARKAAREASATIERAHG